MSTYTALQSKIVSLMAQAPRGQRWQSPASLYLALIAQVNDLHVSHIKGALDALVRQGDALSTPGASYLHGQRMYRLADHMLAEDAP
jgi:hypothetical protein